MRGDTSGIEKRIEEAPSEEKPDGLIPQGLQEKCWRKITNLDAIFPLFPAVEQSPQHERRKRRSYTLQSRALDGPQVT